MSKDPKKIKQNKIVNIEEESLYYFHFLIEIGGTAKMDGYLEKYIQR